MRLVWVVIPLVLIGIIGMQESIAEESEFIASPRHQLESGITPEEILCREDRILVIRTNGEPACVTEKTAEKMNWKIVQKKTVKTLSEDSMIPELKTIKSEIKEESKKIIDYDERKLNEFITFLIYYYPDEIDNELKEIFDDDSKQILDDFYKTHVYLSPIDPDSLSTTRIQLKDTLNCKTELFVIYEQKIRCAAPLYLEDGTYDYPQFEVIDREEAISLLTINIDSQSELSDKQLIIEKERPSRKAVMMGAIDYGYFCSPLISVIDFPEQVEIGEEFEINLKYSWVTPDKDAGYEDPDEIVTFFPFCEQTQLQIRYQEIELLSEGFEIKEMRTDPSLITYYYATKQLRYDNTTQFLSESIKFRVNEPVFRLTEWIEIFVNSVNLVSLFSSDEEVVTFSNKRLLYGHELSSNIDKFGNRLPVQQKSGSGIYDRILYDFVLGDDKKYRFSLDERRELQKQFSKYQVFHPNDDFADYYRSTYGEEIPIEVDYVKLGPPMDEFADFIKEHYSHIEDIETWLREQPDLHDDWIDEFLKQYPELKN